ncbi:MAG: thioredoxin domain-containing protein [Candidatus Margulisbacteria bacterium]|nr:thioredoxin domain-containing protein [Candidatus Margulisiibacteriota bacterium]
MTNDKCQMKVKIFTIIFLMLFIGTAWGMGETVKKQKEPVEIETELVQAALASGKPTIIELGAGWCQACQAMKPVIKSLKNEKKGELNIFDLDIEKYRDLAWQYKATIIPTILFFDKQGDYKGKYSGYMSKDDILKAVDKLELNK